MSRDNAYISAVADDTIVLDDLVGVAVLDTTEPPGRIVWANPAFSSVLARAAGDLTGLQLDEVVDDPDVAAGLAVAGGGGEHTVRLDTPGNAAVLQLSPTGGGQVVVVARPVHTTARAALYDAVTGLASLALFREHLQLGINRRARDGDDIAVVAIGASSFGSAWQRHPESGSLLQARMGERIEQIVRDADVLAARRPGGFLLLVIDPADAVAAATLASERMLAAFETPLVLAERLQPLDLHIGIAAALPEDDPDRAIARADAALTRAVDAGANVYRVELG
ncbi:MAG TPA: diguanylate cyclase [Euzebyales bacterium]|nr:diguanylate cyclase [Euzebyales bacterium]